MNQPEKCITVTRLNRPPTDVERSNRLFSGELLRFPETEAGAALLVLVQQLLCEALGDDEPTTAHQRLNANEWLDRIGALQRHFPRNEAVRAAFRESLASIGVDPADSYWDSCVLRAVAPGAIQHAARRGFVPPHRDTWGANLPAQVNWWMPVYPLAENRGLCFFPDYWAAPVANSTARWRFDEFLAARRQDHHHRRASYPSAPGVEDDLAEARRQIVLPAPGEWLAFSSAHLHGSVENHGDRARFSLEVRTLSASDLRRGAGAPDVDNDSREGPRFEWFQRISDDARLNIESPPTD